MGVDVAFWLFAVISVGAALAVVFIKDLFRAALCLILLFFMIAGLFVTLHADLLAGLQVLIYVGAIALLIMFAIMLTKDIEQANRFNKLAIPVAVVTLFLMITIISAVADSDNFASLDSEEELNTLQTGSTIDEDQPSTGSIGQLMFSDDNGYLLLFEVAGTLLLASVIGAMVLARERE